MNYKLLLSFLFLTVAPLFPYTSAIAQVTSANDSTGTRVTRNGERFEIDGGSLSRDGQNLFHSFEEFGLSADQIANFLSSPDIQNVLGRVVGGNASIIDGLITLTGGNSNLYLMNPAGIIFGSNARLDVPGSFTATTANGIGFDNTWFNAIGENDYALLVGNPSAFAFTPSNPGSIFNSGELAVNTGQSLTLLGGTVINTGSLEAPGGTIIVAAVPGENLVRISQDEALLSLELETLNGGEVSILNALPFTPLDLPTLLAGSSLDHASEVTVAADGTVRLTSSNTVIPTGSGVAIASGTLDTSTSIPSSLSPEINVLGDRVGILNATLDASTPNAGGTIRVGGDYQGEGTIFNASRTFVDGRSAIAANALEVGDGGRVIVWADETTGFYGEILARGGQENGDGGFVEVSGKQELIFRGDVDVSAENGTVGSLLLDPENIIIVDGDGGADDAEINDNAILGDDSAGATFTISETALEGLAANANVTLVATNDITVNDLEDNNLNLPTAPSYSIAFTALDGAFTMNPDDTITTQGGNLTISGNTIALGGIDMTLGGNLSLRGNEIDLVGGDESIQTRDSPASECCFIAISPPFGSNQDIVLGGIAENPNSLDLTQNDLNAFSKSPLNSAIYRIGTNGNLTIPDNPIEPLQFNRNLFLNAGETLTIERELEVSGPIVLRGSEIDLLAGENSIRSVAFSGDTTFSTIRLYSRPNQDIQIGAVDGSPESQTTALDLTLNDLAALQPARDTITIGRLNNRQNLQVGNITVLPGAADLPFNEDIRIFILETNEGIVQVQREITIDNLVVTAADVEIDAPINAQSTVTLQPSDPASTIGIGDTPFGDFNISQDELTNLNTTGTVSIGNPITIDANGQEVALGEVQVRDVNLRDTPALEDYNLTITGGAIRLFNSGAGSNQSAIRLADNRTLQLISTEFIQQGDGTDVSVFGEEGSVLIDAATDIANNGDGFLEVQVRNIAARSRDGGNILLNLQLSNSRISSVGGVDGISTVGDGDIDIRTFGLRPDVFAIDAPITANGAGDIRVIARGSRENGQTTIAVNAPITTVTGDIEIAVDAENPPQGLDNPLLQDNSTIDLSSTVTSESGSIEFWDPVVARGGAVTADTGSVTFGDRVLGDQILAVDAGIGTVQFNEAIGVDETGAVEPLLGLEIDAGDVIIQAPANLGAEGLTIDASESVAIANILQVFDGGQVDISTNQNIATAGIFTVGGAIALVSGNGDVVATARLRTTNEANNGDAGEGGDVLLRANNGDITTDQIFTRSLVVGNGNASNGGDIEIDASGNVSTRNLETNSSVAGSGSTGSGGNIDVNAGGTLTINGQVDSRSQVVSPVAGDRADNGGDISFNADGNINIDGRIISLSRASGDNEGAAGDITVISGADVELRSGSTTGTPQAINADAPEQRGDVRVEAAGDVHIIGEDTRPNSNSIVAGDFTLGAGESIDIDLLVDTASIQVENVAIEAGANITLTNAPIQSTGRVELTVGGTITTQAIMTDGGTIALSNADTITLQGDVTTNGGNFRVLESDRLILRNNASIDTEGGHFIYRNLDSAIRISGSGQLNTTGGDFRLRGDSVRISSDLPLDASDPNGRGGDISVIARERQVRIGDLNSSGRRGGDIEILAPVAIQTEGIDSSGSIGNGGDVFLDPDRDIQVAFINAQGGDTGRGGSIDATTRRFFRATETFVNRNGTVASLSTAGGIEGGAIIIRHDGGARDVPFRVGQLSDNGTLGAITSGNGNTIVNRSFRGSFTLGNIQLITTDPEPPIPTPPPPLPIPSDPEVPSEAELLPPDETIDGTLDGAPPSNGQTETETAVLDPGVQDIDGDFTQEYEDYDPQVAPPGQPWTPIPPPDESPVPIEEIPSPSGPETLPGPSTADLPDDLSPNVPESPDRLDEPGSLSPDPLTPADGSENPRSPISDPAEPPDTAPPSTKNPDIPPTNPEVPPETPDAPNPYDNTTASSEGMSISDAQFYLQRIEQQTGIKPALIYAIFTPNPTADSINIAESQDTPDLSASGRNDSDQLELLLVTGRGSVIRLPVVGARRGDVLNAVRRFRQTLFSESTIQSDTLDHQRYAQQFYQWLVAPLETELEGREIDTIAFLMDEGLRALPLAALYDGEQYLVEDYSIGLMPSLSLTNMEYVNINDADVLAMGASKFDEFEQEPLPATEVETAVITDTLWDGEAFMNEAFTYFNLQQQRQETPYGIVHLATHANFQRNNSDEAYIQLSDQQLRLSEIRELGWHDPVVELVVLSACETAVGDGNTELGFAGFSALAGVKSTLASLWTVDDAGTLGLMVEFYQQLSQAPIKAEALREAQLAMLRGEVYIQDGTLVWSGGDRPLPIDQGLPESLSLSHPSFWAGFTMVGSPW